MLLKVIAIESITPMAFVPTQNTTRPTCRGDSVSCPWNGDTETWRSSASTNCPAHYAAEWFGERNL